MANWLSVGVVAKSFIDFLASPQAITVIRKTALEAVASGLGIRDQRRGMSDFLVPVRGFAKRWCVSFEGMLPDAPARFRAGRLDVVLRLGASEIVTLLGSGGMGEV
jgi:hypothetical protein